jgi:hypothetical protein
MRWCLEEYSCSSISGVGHNCNVDLFRGPTRVSNCVGDACRD